MKITYDKITDAMYIYFNKTKVSKTVKITDSVLADLDKNGKILGIEILDASSHVKQKKPVEFKIKIPAFA